MEDSAPNLIATWYRQGPARTQQFNVNHGHPDGDLLTSILAYEWFLECQKTYSNKYGDWKTNATQEWKACSKVGLIHHVMVAIHESVLALKHTFDEHRHAFPEVPKRRFGSPGYSALLLHSVWTSFFDRCLIKLPTGEEWLVERDWYIVNHWEDQFCRDVYQDLCVFAEFQHLRATALISPGTTPLVCPVDSLVNTHPSPLVGPQVTMKTLDPCAWRYVLMQDDFRLQTRSDVVGTWETASTTYNFLLLSSENPSVSSLLYFNHQQVWQNSLVSSQT